MVVLLTMFISLAPPQIHLQFGKFVPFKLVVFNGQLLEHI